VAEWPCCHDLWDSALVASIRPSQPTCSLPHTHASGFRSHKRQGISYALARKDLAVKMPRGPDLHYLSCFSTHFYLTGLVQMEERALSFVGKSQRGAFAYQVLCTYDTSIAYTPNVLCWKPLRRMSSKLKRPPTFLRFCTLWSKNQTKSRRSRNATKDYRPPLRVVIEVSATY